MSIIDELITSHQKNEYYGARDLNRVGSAIKYVVQKMREFGWDIQITDPKTDWTDADIPNMGQIRSLLSSITSIKNCLSPHTGDHIWPSVPSGARPFNADDANDIERILELADDLCKRIASAWYYSGEFFAGEGI